MTDVVLLYISLFQTLAKHNQLTTSSTTNHPIKTSAPKNNFLLAYIRNGWFSDSKTTASYIESKISVSDSLYVYKVKFYVSDYQRGFCRNCRNSSGSSIVINIILHKRWEGKQKTINNKAVLRTSNFK